MRAEGPKEVLEWKVLVHLALQSVLVHVEELGGLAG